MKYLFICNKTEPFIKELQKALLAEKIECDILQINGMKLIKEKTSKNLQIKTPFNFLSNIPKLKVIHKIASIKKAIESLGDFDHIIFFFYNWSTPYIFKTALKQGKVSFYLSDFTKINRDILKKTKKVLFLDPKDSQTFKKFYQKNFSDKADVLYKIIDFSSFENIQTKTKQKRIYCDIREVENLEKFFEIIKKLDFEFIFPLIGESFERREKINKILHNSNIKYQIFNTFLSPKENYSLILSSKIVLALSNPKYSNTIPLSLFGNKRCLIFEKYLYFFSKNKFHFATINQIEQIERVLENIENNYKTEDKQRAIKEFAPKYVAKRAIRLLEN